MWVGSRHFCSVFISYNRNELEKDIENRIFHKDMPEKRKKNMSG
jgi:hypothetical protein